MAGVILKNFCIDITVTHQLASYSSVRQENSIGPSVRVDQAARSRGLGPGHWIIAWNIQNLSREPLQILSGRLPHSRFRSEERGLSPIPKLLPNESAQLEFSVACSEPPGTVVENAFLILRVLWLEEPWWLFGRLRVTFDELGGPQSITEVITTHRIGFSK